jgi:large subunit ribosomal protein L15
MTTLETLSDTHRTTKGRKRVGRGPSSGMGKTSGRGHNGAGSRSGYKRRHTYEGGQFRLFKKLPCRGFSNVRFQKRPDAINLALISEMFEDGETVNETTLREHGYISGPSYGIKILGDGDITKKVTIEANAFSEGARKKLEAAGVTFTIV